MPTISTIQTVTLRAARITVTRMVVITLEKVPPSLRGELSRWMIEVQTGVYVGSMSAKIRDDLWNKVVQHAGAGRCTQLYQANNEQGFLIRTHGEMNRSVIELDGYQLVAVKNARYQALLPKLCPRPAIPEDWETI